MKRDKLTFLIAELILIVLAAFFIHKIFREDVAQKRVAVILQNSGDTRWEGVINGLKQSAKNNNLHLIICNTDDIVSAQDERELIEEQLENDVDAFIPGTGGRYKGDAGLAWRTEAVCADHRGCVYEQPGRYKRVCDGEVG